jgi:hypothetical protein
MLFAFIFLFSSFLSILTYVDARGIAPLPFHRVNLFCALHPVNSNVLPPLHLEVEIVVWVVVEWGDSVGRTYPSGEERGGTKLAGGGGIAVEGVEGGCVREGGEV